MSKKIILIIMFLLCAMPSIVFADNDLCGASEYHKNFVVNKNYDASNIKNVIVMFDIPQPTQQNVDINYIQEKSDLINNIKKYFAKDKNININVTMFDDLVSRINSENNIDFTELNKTDPPKANTILANYLKQYDTCFTVHILMYYIDSRLIPEFSYDDRELVENGHIYDSDTGKWVPDKEWETVTVTVPEHYDNTSFTDFLMTLTDINTKQVIFSHEEWRKHESTCINDTDFENPEKLANQTLHNYINDTLKMVRKSKKIIAARSKLKP